MTRDDFIICMYLKIAEYDDGIKLRKAGFPPRLSDAEALTISVVGEFLGIHTDKGIWRYFKTHYEDWFPQLRDRTCFVRQCANLLPYKQKLLKHLFADAQGDMLHMQDGVPIPVMLVARSGRDKCFAGEASWGYCASKDMKYYGFMGHVQIDSRGRLSGFMLTPANGSEREAMEQMCDHISGIMLADKGYISESMKQQLAKGGVELHTPLRNNMTDTRNPDFVKWVISTRRLVETVIGQLTERFSLNKIKVKDLWHLNARIARKLLAHVIATQLPHTFGYNPTQLDLIIQA
jgi:Transposase DDE domain